MESLGCTIVFDFRFWVTTVAPDMVYLYLPKYNNTKEVSTAVTKNQKSIHVLTGLGGDVSIGTPEEVSSSKGRTIIQIPVTINHHIRRCPNCGSNKANICDSGENSWAWHIPQGRRNPCKVTYHKERYICKDCGTPYMEPIPWIRNNGSSHITLALSECIKDDLHNYTTKYEVARLNCVSTYYVDLIADDLRPPVPSSLPEVICLDETHSEVVEQKSGNNTWVKFTTNFSDGKTGRLLDVLPFRTKKKLVNYFFSNFSSKERKKVKFLCCDMGPQYLYLAQECFPNASVCLDNYHVTNRLNQAVNAIRIKEQNYLHDKKDDAAATDLKHLSHKLVTSVYNQPSYWADKEESISARLMSHFETSPELKDAYAMLQYFHEIFNSSFDYKSKCEDLDLWIKVFSQSTSEEIYDAVKSVTDHLEYIHNAWKNGLSNAVCEGNNNIIQTIKTMSFGIRDFDYFRTRALLIAGRPGVSRQVEKKAEENNGIDSFFFREFPDLSDYSLSFDWQHPHIASKPVE